MVVCRGGFLESGPYQTHTPCTLHTHNVHYTHTHTTRTGLRTMGYNIDDSEGEQLLLGLDINHDGSVTFDEFAACLLDWKQVGWV